MTSVLQDQQFNTIIQQVQALFHYVTIGDPMINQHHGKTCIDIPLLYNGFVLDKIHYDAKHHSFSPKGMPCTDTSPTELDPQEIRETVKHLLKETRIIKALEYREPENAWVVPIQWKYYVIAHIKVNANATQIIPDYHATQEYKQRMTRL